MARSRPLAVALFACALAALTPRGAAAETVLLDFTSAHCPPCREMDPVVQRLAAAGYGVRQIDVGREPAAAQRFSVTMTPTFVVLVDGREWARLVGKTSQAQLVEMMHKATALAAAQSPSARGPAGAGAVSSIDFAVPASATSAAGPQEGRVVPIQDPFARRTPPGSPLPAAASRGAAAPAADADQLIAATVRLSIVDASGKSTGTGAIVDARNGMALVLTCGHLFRDSNGLGAIEISLFTPGPNGAEVRGTVAGELLDFDLDRDLALVRFRTESPVAVAPIAPPGVQLTPGAAVTSVGCSHGANPTAWSTRITTLNRYQGHPNVEASGAPVEGRSGGGLFNAQGQLIGVCFAADHEGDEGLYASLPSIHAKLDELQLSMVYQAPATGGGAPRDQPAAAGQLAAAPPAESFAVRGQSPVPAAPTSLPAHWPAASCAPLPAAPPADAAATVDMAALSPDERAAFEEIARRGVGSEVICIIRPQSPDGRSEVIKLSGVSPALVRAISSAGSAGAPAATAAVPGGAAPR